MNRLISHIVAILLMCIATCQAAAQTTFTISSKVALPVHVKVNGGARSQSRKGSTRPRSPYPTLQSPMLTATAAWSGRATTIAADRAHTIITRLPARTHLHRPLMTAAVRGTMTAVVHTDYDLLVKNSRRP